MTALKRRWLERAGNPCIPRSRSGGIGFINKKLSPRTLQLVGEAFAFGLTLAGSVALAWWVGGHVDRLLGLSVPLVTLVLILGAVVASFVRLIRNVSRWGRPSGKGSGRSGSTRDADADG